MLSQTSQKKISMQLTFKNQFIDIFLFCKIQNILYLESFLEKCYCHLTKMPEKCYRYFTKFNKNNFLFC